MSGSPTRTNRHSAGAILLACVLISLFSAAELPALATAAKELIAGTSSVVQPNASFADLVAARNKVSPLLQKRLKRKSLDLALLTLPTGYNSQANLTSWVLSTDNQLPYGFNFTCAVPDRGPPFV